MIAQILDFRDDRLAGPLGRIGRQPFDAERIRERRASQEDGLEQRVAVDDLVRLLAARSIRWPRPA